jgi:hypothetical protein
MKTVGRMSKVIRVEGRISFKAMDRLTRLGVTVVMTNPNRPTLKR